MVKTWLERLKTAEKCKFFTSDDQIRSENWLTCAVGELELINKPDGMNTLGMDFKYFVQGGYIKKAQECYNQIHKLAETA